jgi:thiol-disulfide isomerase/thioredoxin
MRGKLILFTLFCSINLFAQEKTFTISGKIKGLDSKYLTLFIFDKELPNGYSKDSILVVNESFTYTAPIKKFLYANISPNLERVIKRTGNGYYPAKSSTLQFFAAPGFNLKFTGEITDFADAYPYGEENNNAFANLNRVIYPLLNESVNSSVKISNKLVTDTTVIKKMKESASLLDKKIVEYKHAFVRNFPNLASAAWQLSDMLIRSQVSNILATEFYNMMDNRLLTGNIYYDEVEKRIQGFSATAVGKIVPEISTKNTYSGNKFELSSLRGKYVIIDFWGTWCGPCIAGMPKMKEYLDKYKDKMEILGVASESDKGIRWKKFILDNPKYQWNHILSSTNEDFILQFSVAGFPTKIIIDPNGKILERYVGEDETIYKRIDELFR